MTMPSPYQPPYANYYGAPQKRRPTSVTVLAIIGIIWAGLTIVCTPFIMLPHVVDFGVRWTRVDVINASTPLWRWTMFELVVWFGLSIVLLSGSIAALRLKRWARRTLVFYAIAGIAMLLTSAIMELTLILPEQIRIETSPEGVRHLLRISGISLLVALTFHVLLLVFMTRPHVIAAFESAGAQQPYQMPG